MMISPCRSAIGVVFLVASLVATAANLLSAVVAELTGNPHNGKISVPSVSTTGRRGRPPKS